MKKSELEAMAIAMAQVANMTASPKFAYAIAKNRTKIQDEINALAEARKPLDEVDKKRLELCRELCDKDEHGKPITESEEIPGGKRTVFKGIAGNEEFDKRLEKIREPYNDKLEELEKLTNEECEKKYDFHMIPLDLFPDKITPALMQALLPMIKDEESKTDEKDE